MRIFSLKTFLFRFLIISLGAVAVIFATASPASALEINDDTQFLLDNLWVIIAAVLVFLMQAGFAFLEAGLTRSKNIANIMAKNLADMSIGAIAFFAIGYGIAFGEDAGSLIGTDSWFLSGSSASITDGLSVYTTFFFQVVFAATAVTIASGAMAERTKFIGYVLFSAAMTLFIYPMVVHSLWQGDGILSDLDIGGARFVDFAGSTIVHSTGGWAAMMGAIFLGPRIGRYSPVSESPGVAPRRWLPVHKLHRHRSKDLTAMPGHNIGFSVLGVFILWFGWFGFNAGSELALDSVVVHALMTTLMAAAAGGIVSGLVVWYRQRIVDVAMVGNGVLAGLVGITAGTAVMNPLGAMATGAIAGTIVVFSVYFFDRIQIDDPVGAISVHGVCGVWGTLAVGLFASVNNDVDGLFYGGGGNLLLVQAIGILIVFVWVTVSSGALFMVLQKLNLLRVSREDEIMGLDVSEHGSSGYGRTGAFERDA